MFFNLSVREVAMVVPLNLTRLHCLQHSFFGHLFNLYYNKWSNQFYLCDRKVPYQQFLLYTSPHKQTNMLMWRFCYAAEHGVTLYDLCDKLYVYNALNGPFRKCQSSSFITVHGRFYFNRLGLNFQVAIWPRKHKRKTPSQDQSKSTELDGVWNFAERCI